jgi:hypothetical protein
MDITYNTYYDITKIPIDFCLNNKILLNEREKERRDIEELERQYRYRDEIKKQKEIEERDNEEREYYNFFIKKIPTYILRNLKNMPNNKGYIIDDIRYFGYLNRIEYAPVILFEKINNNLTYIHEYTNKYYKILMYNPNDKKAYKKCVYNQKNGPKNINYYTQ